MNCLLLCKSTKIFYRIKQSGTFFAFCTEACGQGGKGGIQDGIRFKKRFQR